MILLIDNYDSFSYNLYQLIGSSEPDIRVVRNDGISVEEIGEEKPDCLILSPGPGRPADAGICEEAVRTFAGKMPILGVCLGHQAICEAFGAKIGYAGRIMHGRSSVVSIDRECRIFRGLEPEIRAARYHSLAVDEKSLPSELYVTGRAENGHAVLTFQNAGATIPPEKLSRMFEQFFRLDASRGTQSGNAGLGLAIAREIVEAHGGAITAHSQAEQVIFTVLFPLSPGL